MTLPWSPIYTVERSGQPEITVYGVVCVTADGDCPLITVGDTSALCWTRSLLKPWQLLSILPTVQAAYPQLKPHHYAMMMASHNGEPHHLEALEEIASMAGLETRLLQCPACYPMYEERRNQLKADDVSPSPLFNPCSGKHLGMLSALKAHHADLAAYLHPGQETYQTLKQHLALFLQTGTVDFAETRDGCGMPNYALRVREIAWLYRQLAHPAGIPQAGVDAILWAGLEQLYTVMRTSPHYVGGTQRLDTMLMQGHWTPEPVAMVAKEGADGLLGVGISPCPVYPEGLGILIKLASGYEPEQLKTVIIGLLQTLKLLKPEAAPAWDTDITRTAFHWSFAATSPEVASCVSRR